MAAIENVSANIRIVDYDDSSSNKNPLDDNLFLSFSAIQTLLECGKDDDS